MKHVNISKAGWTIIGVIPRNAAANIVACFRECWRMTGIVSLGHDREAKLTLAGSDSQY